MVVKVIGCTDGREEISACYMETERPSVVSVVEYKDIVKFSIGNGTMDCGVGGRCRVGCNSR